MKDATGGCHGWSFAMGVLVWRHDWVPGVLPIMLHGDGVVLGAMRSRYEKGFRLVFDPPLPS